MSDEAAATEPIEGDAVEVTLRPGQEVRNRDEVRGEMAILNRPALAVTPAVEASELVARMNVIQQAADTAMVRDVDFGVIPGTNKPALMKPGAEKLGVLFQLDIQLDNEKVWDGDHLTVMSRATVYHAPSGSRLGFGEGLCTTREKKYAKRKADRLCPECGKPTVLESRDRDTKKPDGSLFCWKKKGGCGANFAAGSDQAKALLAVKPGEIDNPDLPDTWNTVVKMAEKRARVDAVLAVTGASALFTQDVEEQQAPAPPEHEPAPPEAIAPDKLLERVKVSGLNFVQLTNWLGANTEGELPAIESEADALTVFHSLTSVERNRLAAAALAYKTEREKKAAAREASLQHDAEAEAA